MLEKEICMNQQKTEILHSKLIIKENAKIEIKMNNADELRGFIYLAMDYIWKIIHSFLFI